MRCSHDPDRTRHQSRRAYRRAAAERQRCGRECSACGGGRDSAQDLLPTRCRSSPFAFAAGAGAPPSRPPGCGADEMSEPLVNVITPATEVGLISLEDAKILLGIPASDVSNDEQLQMLIDQNSMQLAMQANRDTFAFEEVEER